MLYPAMFLRASFLMLIVLTGCITRKKATLPMEIKTSAASTLTADLLKKIMAQHPDHFDSLLKKNDQWKIRIIYTQIDRDASNKPEFVHHYFNLDTGAYFYPASTVKMPVALLALQRLNQLNIPGLDRNSTMITDAAYPGQAPVYNDPTSEDGRPSIAHYIKKIFLVSDNEAYNRLYEFLGQEYINRSLHQMGYDCVQIVHRLQVSMTEDQHRHTNPVKFFTKPGDDTVTRLIYQKPAEASTMPYQQRNSFLGKGYMSGGKLVNQPFDFSKKNRISLADLHSVLQSVIFPSSVPARKRFNLSEDDLDFLYRYMSMKPGESRFPQYDSSYTDAYSKLLLFGGKGDMPGHIRVFNKEGDAYGFLTDVAYIVDFKNGVEFLLSASIHCNSDGIYNDNRYDYDTVGFPFLKHLGEAIYQYELQRPKKRLPDLSRFQFNYND